MARNLKRGLVHIAAGLFIAAVASVASRPLMILLLGLLTGVFIVVDLIRLRWKQLNLFYTMMFGMFMREYEIKRVTGASFLLLGSLVSMVLYGNEITVLAVSFLAIGDPLAHFAEDRWGKTRIGRKTLQGGIACFIGCAIIGLLWYSNARDVSLAVVFTGAVAASITHLLPVDIDDNLTIPVLSGGAMWLLRLFV
jgi:dolichol kinase